MRRVIFLVLAALAIGKALGQPISLRASSMKGEKIGGVMTQILNGDVQFDQNGNTVYCDKAEYNTKEEELRGFGNVRIVSSDGVIVTGERLVFSNKNKTARVEGGVKLTDRDMVLTTPWINYNTNTKIGWYGSGGKIVDGSLTLTSVSGSYNPNIKTLFFKNNVVLVHPDYTMKGDTLQYHTGASTAYFFAYTEITSAENTILCNHGWYNTKTGKAEFTSNAALFSKENIIRADTLSFDRNSGTGIAKGRLWVKDTLQKVILYGHRGYYDKNRKYTRVTGSPVAKKFEPDGDSMLIRADTFIYFQDTVIKKRFLKAYRHTQMLKSTFSGICDSLTYIPEDSAFYFHQKPVLWNENTRTHADTIHVYLKNSRIHHMKLRGKSFVAMEEDTEHYSQISGDSMDNSFNDEGKIDHVWVRGGSKSIYYIKENDSAVTSANYIEGQSLVVYFDSGKVNQIQFYESPVGTIYPLPDLPSDKQKLQGFAWDQAQIPHAEMFLPPFEVPPLPSKKDLTVTNKELKRKRK